MDDQSLMPFGKYKGEKLENVPARYLLWLWDSGVYSEESPLHDYIENAFSVLESEATDYIVQHPPK